MSQPSDFNYATATDTSAQSLEHTSTANTLPDTLEPGLYIVATPIGNLRDITLRALDILTAADLILAEDTRQTRKLLDAYRITTPMQALHDHNEAKATPQILDRLKAGERIAQVSDAGTPLISDPGYKLINAAIDADYPVIPVPGASAVMAGLVTAGLPTDKFTFCGFLPPKTTARKKALTAAKAAIGTLIYFESPRRILAALEDIKHILGERDCVIARELTKRYETILRAPVSELIAQISATPPKGEIVLMVAPASDVGTWDTIQIDAAIAAIDAGQGLKQASQDIASASGWSKRDVYNRALELRSREK